MEHSVLIVKKERQRKEHDTHQVGKTSKCEKKKETNKQRNERERERWWGGGGYNAR